MDRGWGAPDLGGRCGVPPRAHLQAVPELGVITDIALDPFPFAGCNATFEALWMGVPVAALAGASLMSRWGAAMLRAAGLDELIAGWDLALSQDQLDRLTAAGV